MFSSRSLRRVPGRGGPAEHSGGSQEPTPPDPPVLPLQEQVQLAIFLAAQGHRWSLLRYPCLTMTSSTSRASPAGTPSAVTSRSRSVPAAATLWATKTRRQRSPGSVVAVPPVEACAVPPAATSRTVTHSPGAVERTHAEATYRLCLPASWTTPGSG